jgi:hypothetical protein
MLIYLLAQWKDHQGRPKPSRFQETPTATAPLRPWMLPAAAAHRPSRSSGSCCSGGCNDGRYFHGLFHCIDKQGNIILQDAVEFNYNITDR